MQIAPRPTSDATNPAHKERCITADAHGGVIGFAAGGANGVGVVTGSAGLRVNIIRCPGHIEVFVGIKTKTLPGNEPVARVAFGAAASCRGLLASSTASS